MSTADTFSCLCLSVVVASAVDVISYNLRPRSKNGCFKNQASHVTRFTFETFVHKAVPHECPLCLIHLQPRLVHSLSGCVHGHCSAPNFSGRGSAPCLHLWFDRRHPCEEVERSICIRTNFTDLDGYVKAGLQVPCLLCHEHAHSSRIVARHFATKVGFRRVHRLAESCSVQIPAQQ